MTQGAGGQRQEPCWRESGFTLLEIIFVLFLLGGLLSLVIPRMSLGDNLSSVGRKWVGALKSFQEMSHVDSEDGAAVCRHRSGNLLADGAGRQSGKNSSRSYLG